MPPLLLVATGLVLDSFAAPALGIHMLMLLFLRALIRSVGHQFARKTVWFFWAGFCLLSSLCWALYWLLAMLATGTALSPLPAFTHWGVTALSYPPLHLVFTRSLAILPPSR
jgi:hypothetical protein